MSRQIVLLRAKVPLEPASSEGLFVCLYICNTLGPLARKLKQFNGKQNKQKIVLKVSLPRME